VKDLQKNLIALTCLISVLLASCYASSALWNWVILISVVGIVWILGQYKHWRWAGNVGLISLTAISGRGVFAGINPLLLLLSVTLALIAWDMNMFLIRIALAERVEKRGYLEKCHYKKLAVTAGTGLILGALSLKLDFNLGFNWLLLLGILLIICMSRLIRILINS
jgi:hypothetical protein